MGKPWVTMIFSILCISYGLFTIYLRSAKPETFSKLAKMKVLYGERMGSLMHLTFYSLFPLAVGIFLWIQLMLGKASL